MGGKFTDLVGRTVGVVIDAETAMEDWTPPIAGRIKKIILIIGGIAATSLIENGYIKLASSTFGGVDEYIPFDGAGIFTAPGRKSIRIEHECDLAVTTKPVRVFYYHNVLPVTPEITVFATIQT